MLSTQKAKCVIADISSFYLNNDLPESEYMRMHLDIIPMKIIDQHNLHTKVNNKG